MPSPYEKKGPQSARAPEHRRSRSELPRPESTGASPPASARLWDKYDAITLDRTQVYSALAGGRVKDYQKIKSEHTAKRIRLGASNEFSATDHTQTYSQACYSPDKPLPDTAMSSAIKQFMNKKYLPFGNNREGPPASIHIDAQGQKEVKRILQGKKVEAGSVESAGLRDEDGKIIGQKVMGSNIPFTSPIRSAPISMPRSPQIEKSEL